MEYSPYISLRAFIREVLHDSSNYSGSVAIVFTKTDNLNLFKKILLGRLSISCINSLTKTSILYFESYDQIAQFVKERISTDNSSCVIYGFYDVDTVCRESPLAGKVITYLLHRLTKLKDVKVHTKKTSTIMQT